jgi:hypothetical protein
VPFPSLALRLATFLLGVAATSACFVAQPPDDARIRCTSDADCPPPLSTCSLDLELCLLARPGEPPRITSASLSTQVGTVGTVFDLTIEVSRALFESPSVRLDTETPLTLVATPAERTYVYRYLGAAADGAGAHTLEVDLVAADGATANGINPGVTLSLDLQPPSVSMRSAPQVASPGSDVVVELDVDDEGATLLVDLLVDDQVLPFDVSVSGLLATASITRPAETADGAWDVATAVSDGAGNEATATFAGVVRVDGTGPRPLGPSALFVTGTARPPADGYAGQGATLLFRQTFDEPPVGGAIRLRSGGVDVDLDVEIEIVGNELVATTAPGAAPEGRFLVTLHDVEDALGNRADPVGLVPELTVDETSPTIAGLALNASAFSAQPGHDEIRAAFTVQEDNPADVTLGLLGHEQTLPFAPCLDDPEVWCAQIDTAAAAALPSDAVILVVTATDLAGNLTTESASATLDFVAPSLAPLGVVVRVDTAAGELERSGLQPSRVAPQSDVTVTFFVDEAIDTEAGFALDVRDDVGATNSALMAASSLDVNLPLYQQYEIADVPAEALSAGLDWDLFVDVSDLVGNQARLALGAIELDGTAPTIVANPATGTPRLTRAPAGDLSAPPRIEIGWNAVDVTTGHDEQLVLRGFRPDTGGEVFRAIVSNDVDVALSALIGPSEALAADHGELLFSLLDLAGNESAPRPLPFGELVVTPGSAVGAAPPNAVRSERGLRHPPLVPTTARVLPLTSTGVVAPATVANVDDPLRGLRDSLRGTSWSMRYDTYEDPYGGYCDQTSTLEHVSAGAATAVASLSMSGEPGCGWTPAAISYAHRDRAVLLAGQPSSAAGFPEYIDDVLRAGSGGFTAVASTGLLVDNSLLSWPGATLLYGGEVYADVDQSCSSECCGLCGSGSAGPSLLIRSEGGSTTVSDAPGSALPPAGSVVRWFSPTGELLAFTRAAPTLSASRLDVPTMTWVPRAMAGAPPSPAGTFPLEVDRDGSVLLFVGRDTSGADRDETWRMTELGWEQVNTQTAPAGGTSSRLLPDNRVDRLLLKAAAGRFALTDDDWVADDLPTSFKPPFGTAREFSTITDPFGPDVGLLMVSGVAQGVVDDGYGGVYGTEVPEATAAVLSRDGVQSTAAPTGVGRGALLAVTPTTQVAFGGQQGFVDGCVEVWSAAPLTHAKDRLASTWQDVGGATATFEMDQTCIDEGSYSCESECLNGLAIGGAVAPPAVFQGGGMAWHASTDSVVLALHLGASTTQTWRFDGGSWAHETSMPPPAAPRALVHLEQSSGHHTWLFGASAGAIEVWELGDSGYTPLNATGTGPPVAAVSPKTVFADPDREVVVVLDTAGRRVFRFDGASWTVESNAGLLAPDSDAAVFYDASSGGPVWLVHGQGDWDEGQYELVIYREPVFVPAIADALTPQHTFAVTLASLGFSRDAVSALTVAWRAGGNGGSSTAGATVKVWNHERRFVALDANTLDVDDAAGSTPLSGTVSDPRDIGFFWDHDLAYFVAEPAAEPDAQGLGALRSEALEVRVRYRNPE